MRAQLPGEDKLVEGFTVECTIQEQIASIGNMRFVVYVASEQLDCTQLSSRCT